MVQLVAIERSGANPKNHPQFGLQAEIRLHEGGVASTASQNIAVNTFSGLVHTARHVMKVGNT